MFDFFAMAIAVVALIVARKSFNQAATLRARLDAIEAMGFRATRATPPPLTARFDPEPTPTTPSRDIAPEQPATVARAEPTASAGADEPAAPNDIEPFLPWNLSQDMRAKLSMTLPEHSTDTS